LISDLDFETSQRRSVVIAEWRKLLRAGGDCRQHGNRDHCCKNSLHGFLLSCRSIREAKELEIRGNSASLPELKRAQFSAIANCVD
jgi:hypothetical protein